MIVAGAAGQNAAVLRWIWVGTLVALVGGACGGGGSEDTARATPQPSSTALPAPATTEPASSPGAAVTPPSTARIGTATVRSSTAANQTVLDHPSGARLTLTVGGTLRYQRGDDIVLSLRVTNRGTEAVTYDTNQQVNFGIYVEGQRAMAWTDRSCDVGFSVGDPPTTGPLTLDPGEHVEFIEEYPARTTARATSVGPDPESCRVPPGRYLVTGLFERCPPDGMVHDDHGRPYCDKQRVEQITARPLAIEILA